MLSQVYRLTKALRTGHVIMKKLFLLAALCLVSLSATAQEFWGHRFRVQTDVAYGDDPAQLADIYTQVAPEKDARPTLIWIHGGGWITGDKATNFKWTLHYLERGWHVVNINYRQGPDTAPLAVDDAMCAYQWVVETAQDGPMRSNRFVISGASAGGHLALVVGLLNSSGDHPCRASTPPSAVVNWFGITDIEAVEEFLARTRPNRNYALTWIRDRRRISDISARYSPLSLITDSAPPIITIHGTADAVVPHEQAVALHSALRTRNRLISIDGGGHGGFTDAQYQRAMSGIFEFLENP